MKLIQTKEYLLLIDNTAQTEVLDNEWCLEIHEEYVCNHIRIPDENPKYSWFLRQLNMNYLKGEPKNFCFYKKIDGSIKKIFAYYPLTKEAEELDLPLLPNPFKETNVEELARESVLKHFFMGEPTNSSDIHDFNELKESYIYGYKTAQSKQFSLEDIEEAYRKGAEMAESKCYTTNKNYGEIILNPLTLDEECKKYIQSLSTQQLPKEFILGEGDTIEEQIKNGNYVR